MEATDSPPPAKRTRRFASPKEKAAMVDICKGFTPANTDKCTKWAVGVFSSWVEERNRRCVDDRCLIDLLKKPNGERLNHWLSRFAVEARRSDGEQYPPETLANLLGGLSRRSKKFDPSAPNFMDKKNSTFKELYGALQVRYRELRVAGVGANVKHAPIVTKEEEDMLWKSGVLGDHDPVALQRAVIFYVGKVFW